MVKIIGEKRIFLVQYNAKISSDEMHSPGEWRLHLVPHLICSLKFSLQVSCERMYLLIANLNKKRKR